MRILITGGAGFIGFHAARALLARGHELTAIDDLNTYYDPALKRARLDVLSGYEKFRFALGDIAMPETFESVSDGAAYDVIVHLAAQAGVRYALENSAIYARSNLIGHHNVLEFARRMRNQPHLVYASSSSVYGNDTQAPYSETARADRPISFYGATKRAGELLSHSYAELYGLRQTGLRFFTVYGPWGRPDMAYWSFTDAILNGEALPVFADGKARRDFTYIDDIIAGVVAIVEKPFVQDGAHAPSRLYNLGNSHPEDVMALVRAIEAATGRTAKLKYVPGPPGDVGLTYADISRAQHEFGFSPKISLQEGIDRFVRWYRDYRSM